MSKSNLGPLIAVVVGVVLAGLAAPLIYNMAVLHTERQARAERNSERQAQSAEERIEARCFVLPTPAEIAECAAQETKASEDARRSEYDLSAQEDMGDWAFFMIWVSVASVAVTTIGIYYVRATLVAAKDANFVVERTAVIQQRAWLSFDQWHLEGVGDAPDRIDGYYISIGAKKSGLTPAMSEKTNLCYAGRWNWYLPPWGWERRSSNYRPSATFRRCSSTIHIRAHTSGKNRPDNY